MFWFQLFQFEDLQRFFVFFLCLCLCFVLLFGQNKTFKDPTFSLFSGHFINQTSNC